MSGDAVRHPRRTTPSTTAGIDLRGLERRLADLAPPGVEESAIAPLVDCMRRAGLLAACAPSTDAEGERSRFVLDGEPGAGVRRGATVPLRGLAHHAARPSDLMEDMAAVGAASLSAGRLFEGHGDAVTLILLHARSEARHCRLDAAQAGALFGVWGAEDPDPVRLDGLALRSWKLFASGADVIDHAIVTARTGKGLRLVLLGGDRLCGRLRPEEWSMSGLRNTASGRRDLDGLAVEPHDLLGGPDDHLREPHLQDGVWRYAAVQMGAIWAMTRAAVAQLGARGQAEAPMQSARLTWMVAACETARPWLLSPRDVERPHAPPEAAASAILARPRVAEKAVALMAPMDGDYPESCALAFFVAPWGSDLRT